MVYGYLTMMAGAATAENGGITMSRQLKLSIGALIVALTTVMLSAPEAQAFSRLRTCYSGPLLVWSIDSQIVNCTMLARNPLRPTEERAGNFYGRGLLYEDQGDDAHAIEDFTTAIGWEANYIDAYEGRGDAYAHSGDAAKAAADYAQAANMGGEDGWNLNERCWARAVRGAPLDRALADCNAALQQYPNEWRILTSRCFVYYRMGNYAAAIADCSGAVQQRPTLEDALYLRGLAKLHSGDVAGGNADIAAAKSANYRIADVFGLYGIRQ
jgi:tetratricopeptide (TPR) repeat protein